MRSIKLLVYSQTTANFLFSVDGREYPLANIMLFLVQPKWQPIVKNIVCMFVKKKKKKKKKKNVYWDDIIKSIPYKINNY